MVQNTGGIDALLQEERSFPPPADFAAKANMADPDIYAKAAADPEGFWAGLAEGLDWFQKWDTALDWSGAPFAKWFIGGKLNVSYNCIDRHVNNGRRNKAAIVWEGEPGDWKVYTYGDLLREVCQFANGLKSLGIKKGDRVTIYLPMTPELPIAMLACARIGAPHSVVFGGSAPSRCATASTTPSPSCSSPLTAAGGAAASFLSSRTPTIRWTAHLPSRRWWCCDAPAPPTTRWWTGATSGGTT